MERPTAGRGAYNVGVRPGPTYSFGSFTLDVATRRLTRAGVIVRLADRHLDVLAQLVARAGHLVTKDELAVAGWHDVAVTDNSVEQAISSLRRVIGDDDLGHLAIVTVPRQGYRFTGEVSRATSAATDAELEAMLAPHRAWVDGRSALETLGRPHVVQAERAFRQMVRTAPDLATGHIGLANALAFRFETTRLDEVPDAAALGEALQSAHIACTLDPASGEAWATLGFVQHRTGLTNDARAAVRQATTLEPDNWRHHVRMAFVSWGEERLRAAGRALQLLPGLALAHWLAASVHVARQAYDAARYELDAGAAAQDAQQAAGGRFPAVGLHWLRGLVLWRQGDACAARDAFARELSHERIQHLYTRECCANAWCALGALHARDGAIAAAALAFDEALARVPGHPMALAGRAAYVDRTATSKLELRLAALRARHATFDAAALAAIDEAARGRHDLAARRVHDALAAAPPGSAGWSIAVDPLIQTNVDEHAWAPVLALLRMRAA